MATLMDFQNQAAALPVEDRAALADWLLGTLPQPDYDVSDDEVSLRVQEIQSGLAQTMSLEELRAAVMAGRAS